MRAIAMNGMGGSAPVRAASAACWYIGSPPLQKVSLWYFEQPRSSFGRVLDLPDDPRKAIPGATNHAGQLSNSEHIFEIKLDATSDIARKDSGALAGSFPDFIGEPGNCNHRTQAGIFAGKSGLETEHRAVEHAPGLHVILSSNFEAALRSISPPRAA